MKRYQIPVAWKMSGLVYVEAENEIDARRKAIDEPLPDKAEYIPDSFAIDDTDEYPIVVTEIGS